MGIVTRDLGGQVTAVQVLEIPKVHATDKLILDIMLTKLQLQRTLMVLVYVPRDIMEQLQEQSQAIATDL